MRQSSINKWLFVYLFFFLIPFIKLRKTLLLAQDLGDRAVEAQACYSLGNTYTLLRDYPTAIDYHLRHLRIAEELMDKVGEGSYSGRSEQLRQFVISFFFSHWLDVHRSCMLEFRECSRRHGKSRKGPALRSKTPGNIARGKKVDERLGRHSFKLNCAMPILCFSFSFLLDWRSHWWSYSSDESCRSSSYIGRWRWRIGDFIRGWTRRRRRRSLWWNR